MNICIKSLRKNFGDKTAVDIPEVYIQSGDLLGLVGNNGAGKTTLFRLLLDLIKADDGEITFCPDNDTIIKPTETETWKDFTGVYIDEGFLIDFLSPEEYFEFIGKTYGMDKATVEARISDFTDFMGGEIIGQKKLIRNLSAGNKQKVGIIAALFNRPQLVILDEPFNFLDPSSQNILKNILTEYHRTTRATILVSSHNLQHTTEISTRIALMEHGRIIKDLQNDQQSAEAELAEYFNVSPKTPPQPPTTTNPA